MSAARQPKADLVVASTLAEGDFLAASVTAYGRHLRLSTIQDMRRIFGVTLKRDEVAVLIEGLSDLHANMIPEA